MVDNQEGVKGAKHKLLWHPSFQSPAFDSSKMPLYQQMMMGGAPTTGCSLNKLQQ